MTAGLEWAERMTSPPLGRPTSISVALRHSPVWRPVLGARQRKAAISAALDIAAALEHPPRGGWYANYPRPMRPELSLLLNTGTPSRILLLAYLDRSGALPQGRERAAQLFGEAVDLLSRTTMPPWLLKGFTGLAWINQHLPELSGDAGPGNEVIDRALLRALRGKWSGHFDLLYGLVGLGIYGLDRLPRPAGREVVRRVVEHLDRLAEKREGRITWLTPPDEIAFTPQGSYSLGMAHGLPAIIGFLARAYEAGVSRPSARRLLEGSIPWLLRQRLPAPSPSVFPPWIYPGHHPSPSRAAWCYGDPGIAAALYGAGRCLTRPSWSRVGIALMRQVARRSTRHCGIRDASLCHGASGLGHQLNRFWQATGDPLFARAARRWYREALAYRHPGGGIAGFERFGTLHAIAQPVHGKGRAGSSADPGLLTGVAGIGLSLIAAATAVEPAWDRVLLLNP